jgi:hypothetical protein
MYLRWSPQWLWSILGLLGACADSVTPTPPTPQVCDGAVPLIDPTCIAAQHEEFVGACQDNALDYLPRAAPSVPDGDADSWPACISDDNRYHLRGNTIPAAAARSVGFESMGEFLWQNACPPNAASFLAARDLYAVPGGLASRVARRQDVHFAEVPGDDKFACAQETVAAQYPDRCAGPAQLTPLINAAFVGGSDQVSPMAQAARIEAALLWFLYLSTLSEIWTKVWSPSSHSRSGRHAGLSPPIA